MIRGSLVRVSRGKMNFAAALLGTTAMSMLAAPAFAQDAAAQDAAADEAGDDAIVVTGIRSSLATALGEKRTSDNIVEVIQAEDIGKLPDQNLAEVQIGRAHVRTPVTNAHLVCRLLLEKKKANTTVFQIID